MLKWKKYCLLILNISRFLLEPYLCFYSNIEKSEADFMQKPPQGIAYTAGQMNATKKR